MSDLPEGWEWAIVGDICVDVRSGFASGKHNSVGDGIPHLRPMNIDSDGSIDLTETKFVDPSTDDRRLLPGDIVFNNTNSAALVGKTALFDIPGEFGFSNHMTRLRVADGILPRFVAAQIHFLWMTGRLASLVTNHVNQASIGAKALAARVRLAIPPMTEQSRIVAAIEEHLPHLDAAGASLDSAWARLNALAARMPDELIEGEIVPLHEVLREPLRNGLSARSSDRGTVRVITLTAVTRQCFVDKHAKFIERPDRSVDDLWLEPGDVLIQRSNTPELVGSAAMYRGDRNWAIFPDLLIRVRTNDLVSPDYVELVLRSSPLRRYFRTSAQGIAGSMPKISQAIVENARLPVPDRARQADIVRVFEARSAVIALQREALERAQVRGRALRRAVLAAAFSGRLVPQDPADEPASVLLERIRAERASTPPATGRRTAMTS